MIMDSEYPPLPRTKTLESSFKDLTLFSDTRTAAINQPTSDSEDLPPASAAGDLDDRQRKPDLKEDSSLPPVMRVISGNRDMILEYTDDDGRGGGTSSNPSPVISYCWQVASRDLILNSPYFRVLLDPNKFAEGRRLLNQRTTLDSYKTETTNHSGSRRSRHSGRNGEEKGKGETDARLGTLLPTVKLPANRFTSKLGVEVIELFLKILSLDSLNEQEQQKFYGEMRYQPPSLISKLVEIADVFNSPHVVRVFLRQCGYAFGKGKVSLTRYTSSLLRINEDRIRQIIFIAMFLEDQAVFQVLTHTLVVLGSRFWLNGVGIPDPDSPRWQYFQNGLEEELYYRRQCVLNSITDLQAFFLRAYGAMEEDPNDFKSAQTQPLTSVPSIRQQPRQFQCRWAFGDSSACDAFNLGQIIRFFSLRTKTVFLGSTLIDPDFTLDPDSDPNHGQNDSEGQNEDPFSSSASSSALVPDISSIIASLKQCPDYQIDSNHTGCGIRRRLLPALDCIERFVGDGRGLLGITLRLWDRHHNNNSHHQYTRTSTSSTLKLDPDGNPELDSNLAPTATLPLPSTTTTTTNSWSWTSRSLRKAYSVDIRFSKIISINPMPPNSSSGSGSGSTMSSSSPRARQQRQQHASSSTGASLRSSPRSPEEDARLFFTARKRNWEA